MTREHIETGIRHLTESIRAGNEWDKANGHKVYAMSAQARSDKAQLRVLRSKLRTMDAPAPVFAYVPPVANR